VRRLGETAPSPKEEQRRPRGRPPLFRDPVRVTFVMEREEYARIVEDAEAQGRDLSEELRRRLAEVSDEARPA